VVAGGGRRQSLSAEVIGKEEFAGYWEYLLEEAIFTAPAHPHWGGTGLIGRDGKLLGIGSLHLRQVIEGGQPRDINMTVPIDLLGPRLDDAGLWQSEQAGAALARPLHGGERGQGDRRRPRRRRSRRRGRDAAGDVIVSVRDESIDSLADFYRKVWASGPAGAEILVEAVRDGRAVWVRIASADRNSFLKAPKLQ
jgi:hypothetical protein